MKNKYLLMIGILILLVGVLVFVNAANFQDLIQGDFNNGTFYQTEYNSSDNFVWLASSNTSGNFTSQIFNAGGNSQWNNISWVSSAIGELPANQVVESSFGRGNANMTGNVLLMHMNEASGTIVDSSGQGNNGTYNGALYSQTGKLNTAIGFDGVDDYVDCGNDASISNIAGDMTIEMWIKPNTLPTSTNIGFIAARPLAGGTARWHYGINDDLSGYNFYNGATEYQSSERLDAGVWSHIAMVLDSGTDIKYYENGVLVDTIAGASIGTRTDAPVTIGKSGVDVLFNGTIDEVAIYNRTLSATEILDIYKRGALRLNLTARSCDDASCDTETFTDINDTSPQTDINTTYNITDNQYFQYKYEFETDNASYSPELYNVSVDYTLLNSAPNGPVVSLISVDGTNRTSSDLNCSATITDDDADNLNVTIQWYKDDVLNLTLDYNNSYSNGTLFNATLGSGNLTVGDVWICGMRLYDGTAYSNYINSSGLTILAKPVVNISLIYPTTNISVYKNKFFNFTVNVSCSSANCGQINVSLDPSVNWWNSSWLKRKEINITNVGSTALTDFPAYLNITYNESMLANFSDLRFLNGSCEDDSSLELAYEIENYTSNKADIWIKIPSLATGINSICMYYDNSGASSGENATGVWDDDYKIVQHLEETSGTHYDSTSNGNNGTQNGGVTQNAVGKIDGADDFDGSDDYVSVPDSSSWQLGGGTGDFIIELWANLATLSQDSWWISALVAQDEGGGTSNKWIFAWDPGADKLTFHVNTPAGNPNFQISSDTFSATISTWYHIVLVRSGDVYTFYKNGVAIGSTTQAGTIPNAATPLTIGWGEGTGSFYGTIDEVRISNTARTADWINQSYQLVANPTTYVGFSSEEDYSAAGKGLISTTAGTTPFYTNATTNPLNISLNQDESQLVTFWVNATGNYDASYDFFAYANVTSNMSINAITETLNITIISNPILISNSVQSPASPTNYIGTYQFNITVSDYDSDYDTVYFSWNSGANQTITTYENVSEGREYYHSQETAITGNAIPFSWFANDSQGNTNTSSGTYTISAVQTSASLALDKIISLQELNSTDITYNITLRTTNKGGSDATNVNLIDSDSSSSPYDLGTIGEGNISSNSYLKTYARNSTTYNVTLTIATVNGTDSYQGNETSANSTEITLIIPSSIANTTLTILKNAEYLSENLTHVEYNLTITIVNSGGSDLTSITVQDSDISLDVSINLNRTQSYSTSGTKTISKTSANTEYIFSKANATYNAVTYNSNELKVLIPALENNASLSLNKIASAYSSTNINITYNITLILTNSGGRNATNVNITDADSTNYDIGTLTAGQTGTRSYLKTFNKSSSDSNQELAIATANAIDYLNNNLINASSSLLSVFVPALETNASLLLHKSASLYSIQETNITYNITLTLTNTGGRNATSSFIYDSNSSSSPYDIGTLTLGQTKTRSYLLIINRTALTINYTLSTATANATDSLDESLIEATSEEIIISVPGYGSSGNLFLVKSASLLETTNTNVTYNITLSLTNNGGRNLTSVEITDNDSSSSPYNIGTLTSGQEVLRSYIKTFNKTTYASNQTLVSASANGTDAISGLVETTAGEILILISGTQTSASFILDKIATIHNITNTTINYNITLRLTNKGGSDATSSNITDVDSSDSPYDLGAVIFNSSIIRSYILNFTRQDTTTYQLLSIAIAQGIDSYSNSLISANSTEINLTIPDTAIGKQIVITKNVVYSSSNSTTVTYNVSSTLYNSGDEDLTSINYIDTDLNDTAFTIDINKGDSYFISKLIILDKAASNTNNQFALGTATISGLNFYSNRPTIRIPGYGGPADVDVSAPASVQTSTSFDTIIQVENVNPDIGQDFTFDYWIANNDETTNYSSGQKTAYVNASGKTNKTATLTSPSTAGTYRFRALVSWVGGTASSYDSFTVTAPSTDSGTGGTSGGGGITGKVIYEVEDKEIKKGITKSLKDGEKVKFNIVQEDYTAEHSLEIIDLKSDRTTITIYSQPITILLYIGEEKKLDLNQDGFYDLYVKLEKIENNKAYVYLKSIYEEKEEPELSPEGKKPEEELPSEKPKWMLNSWNKVKLYYETSFEYIKKNKIYFITGFGSLIFILLLIIILIKIVKRKKRIKPRYAKNKIRYLESKVRHLEKLNKRKEKENKLKEKIKKLKSKTFLVIIFSFMLIGLLFVVENNITGFVVGESDIKSTGWNIFGFILIIGVLGLLIFLHKKKIKSFIEKGINKIKKKYPKNNIKGLIKKKVYTEEGEYIGRVKDIILGDYKIDSLKIKLEKIIKKEKGIKNKGIIVKYKDIRNVKHVVIIDKRISEHLEKLDLETT